MRKLREDAIIEPIDRYNRIGNLIKQFNQANLLEQWNFKVNDNFAYVKTKQLYHCKVLDSTGNQGTWEDYENRRIKHTQPLKLLANQWVIVYTGRDYDSANSLLENMKRAAGGFGILVQDPQWIEVPAEGGRVGPKDFIKAIKSDVNPTNCKIVIVIIADPTIKKDIKSFLDKGGVPSQFITASVLQRARMNVFSNILKQMNAKLKLDLYRLSLPYL